MKLKESPTISFAHLQKMYVEKGVDAWKKGWVPHQISSSPLLASQFAHLIASYEKKGSIQILELGAGPGKLAFHLLNELEKLNVDFHYTYSDISLQNIAFCQNHPQLQKWIQQKKLSFQKIDILHLNPENWDVLIAGYLFTTVPQIPFLKIKDHLEGPLPSTPLDKKIIQRWKDESKEKEESGHGFYPSSLINLLKKLPSNALLLLADKPLKTLQSLKINPTPHGPFFSLPVFFPLAHAAASELNLSFLSNFKQTGNFTIEVYGNTASLKEPFKEIVLKANPEHLLDIALRPPTSVSQCLHEMERQCFDPYFFQKYFSFLMENPFSKEEKAAFIALFPLVFRNIYELHNEKKVLASYISSLLLKLNEPELALPYLEAASHLFLCTSKVEEMSLKDTCKKPKTAVNQCAI